MKNLKIAAFVNKIPLYIFVILILPTSFNFAFPMIVEINHNHYEMMSELGEVAMLDYLMENLELAVWDLSADDVTDSLWQIQVIQIVLTVMQQLVLTVFVLFVVAMAIYYLTRRRIKFKQLFRYAALGLLVGGFVMLLAGTTHTLVFLMSLVLAACLTGVLSYNELKMAITKDYLAEENINNGIY